MVRPEVLMTRCITTTASSGDGRSLRSLMNRPTMKRLPRHIIYQYINLSIYQSMSCPTDHTVLEASAGPRPYNLPISNLDLVLTSVQAYL